MSAIKFLEDYKKAIEPKMVLFTERLASVGITIAEVNKGEYSAYLRLTKRLESSTPEQATELVIMTQTRTIQSVWFKNGKLHSEDVSPVLMAEFGSGMFARDDEPTQLAGAGRGTFPNQTHAFDEEGWWWRTPDGKDHHSFGERPSAPLLNAYNEMVKQYKNIAREVFDNG